jgi:DNA-binding beta-propeller fold protein YncE
MKASRNPCLVAATLTLVPILTSCEGTPEARSADARLTGIPTFQVDPTWPQTLPNDWIWGPVTGVFVDARDHVWVVHLPEDLIPQEIGAVQDPPIAECCVPAPLVIEFDPAGNVVQAWGEHEEQEDWPYGLHGIFVDHEDHVWIAARDQHHLLKFSRDGDLLLTIGEVDEPGGSNDPGRLNRPADVFVDAETNELFVVDGYGNRRVIVFDAATGAYLRHWGAYGEPPDDDYEFGPRGEEHPPARQFGTVHGLTGSRDGLIYVADRRNNRIQVFQRDGEFVMERLVAPNTQASGTAFDVALSHDPAQEFLYLADGTNHKVRILRRENLEPVGEFGGGGRLPGQFIRPHNLDVDSRGNLYVTEAAWSRRIQRFTLVGSGGD